MKKIMALLLLLALVLPVMGCGSGGSSVGGSIQGQDAKPKAKIELADGSTVQMTREELYDDCSANPTIFKDKYSQKTVTVTGKIKGMTNYRQAFGTATPLVFEISLEDGWTIIVIENVHKDTVSSLRVGDTITVTSKLQSVYSGTAKMFSISQSGYKFNDGSTITVNSKAN